MGRRLVAVAAVAAASVVVAGPVGGTPPAGAAVVLNVTATPSSGLRLGDLVELTVSNLDATSLMAAGQCDRSIVDAPDPFAASLTQCPFDFLIPPVDGRVTRTVLETFQAPGLAEPVHCGDAPGDCVMFVSTDAGSIGFAPIDVVPSPLAAAPPSVVAGDEVHVWASGAPGAALTIAQCGLPAPATLSGDCPVTVPLTLDATGRGAVTLRPVRTFPTSAGTVDCEITRCAVVSFDASGAQLAVVGLDVLRPSFLLDVVAAPAEGLVDGQAITVEVTANTTEPLLVGQCGVSITSVGSLAAGPCRDVRELTVPPNPDGSPGSTTITYEVARAFVGEDGSQVDCAGFSSCLIAVDTIRDDDASLATARIEFEHPPAVVTTSDTTRLLDGQVVSIDVTGLRPGTSFIQARCDRSASSLSDLIDHCAPPAPDTPPFVAADAAGNLHVEYPATQRYTTVLGTTQVYCRDQCRLTLFRDGGSIEVPYTMARGRLTVSPAKQLTDGRTVTVTGHRLMASYAGPALDGVPTGQWVAYQCAAGVVRDPSPAGVARNCVAAPVAVTVPPSGDVAFSLTVHGTVQPPQGQAVDCARAQKPCRIVLHRLEQDGTTTLRSATIRFRDR